ncbi:hypothetical protein NOZE110980_19780 [Nocardioides zeicaulis]
MQHDLARSRQPVIVGSDGNALGAEVEGRLGAGEVTEGSGTSRTERRGRAQRLQRCGAVGDGGVEVVGVGEVELGVHPHHAVVVHVTGVEGDVTGVVVEVLVGLEVLVVLTGLEVRPRGNAEVVALDRFGDEPVELRRADLPGDGGDLGVDPPRRLGRECGNVVDGGLGDQACSPRRDAAGVHLSPEPRQPMPQLERVADQLLRRRGRDAQHRPELGEQNSVTSGHLSPAMGSSWSTPGTVNAAASWIEPGGCRSAHRAARSS